MKKQKSMRKADLGGPIVTILIAIVGIAIAGIVIGYAMGLVGHIQKPIIDESSSYISPLDPNGTKWKISIVVSNPTGKPIRVTNIAVMDDESSKNATIQGNGIVGANSKATIVATINNAVFEKQNSYRVTVAFSTGDNEQITLPIK